MVHISFYFMLMVKILLKTIKDTEALVITSMEIYLDVNAEKTKYMILSRDQNAG